MNSYSDPQFIGRMVGMVLFGSLAVFGLVKCILIMRRKTTSSLCVVSLLSFVFAWLLGTIAEAASPGYGPDTPFVKSLAVVLMIVIAFTGLILGIVGLAMYGPKGERFLQGRKQAWWGIALNGLIMLIFLGGVGRILWRNSRINAVSSADQVREITDVTNNFSLKMPDGRWAKVDSTRFGGTVKLLLGKSRPEMYQMVSCEQISEDAILELDAAAEIWKSQIRANTKTTQISTDRLENINGAEFLHFTTTADVASVGATLAYDCWMTIQAGRVYQLMTYGGSKNQSEIEECGLAVARGFRIADTSLASARKGALLQDVMDHPWGFTTRLAKLGWKSWPGAGKNFPGAVFGAYHAKDSYIGVVPLPVQSTSIDLPTATEALLLTNGGISLSKEKASRKSIKLEGADEAIQISLDLLREGVPIHYDLRIVRCKNRYLLLLAWANTSMQKNTAFLIDALDAINITRLDKLPDLATLTKEQRQKMSLSLHQCGMAAHQRQEEQQAAGLFSESFAISPYNPRTLESVAFTLSQSGKARAGLDLLKQNASLFPEDQALAFMRARLENETGDGVAADHVLEIFNKGYRNEDDLLTALGILLTHDRSADAVKMIGHFLEGGGTPRVRRWLAVAREQSGDAPGAMEILEKLVSEPPFDAETGYRYAETANNTSAHDKATAMVARLIKEGFDGARTRLIEGWAHAGRKEWREAKASFELAAKSAPNEPSIDDAIARASSALGEGDNSSLKNPIPALEIPASLKEQLAKAAAMPASDGASAQYIDRVTLYQYGRDAPLTTTVYQDIRLIDSGGIPSFSTLVFPFDPLSEDIHVNSLVVRNPDGSEAAKVKSEEQYVVDESSSSAMATSRKELRIAVPGLKVGRTIHVVVTRREKSVAPAFPWQQKIISGQLPCNLEAVVVIADPATFRIVGNDFFNKSAVVRRSGDIWQGVISPVPQYFNEQTLPLPDSFLPVVSLGDAKADWAGVTAEYRKDLEDRLKPEPSVTSLAHELTDSLKTNIEKIRALARHVQKEITYQGLEFGRRARRPNAASHVIACHYGDCKDQALLLHQLLKAVGIPSNLALVSTDQQLVGDLPSLDQFNHMIVHVPELPCAFIDTTGTSNPAGYLPPDLYTRQALVLDPVKPAVVAFPDPSRFPADKIRIDRQVAFDEAGSALVNEKLNVAGYYAAYLRAYLAGQTKEQRVTAVQSLLNAVTSCRLEDLDLNGLEDVGEPLGLSFRYRIPAGQGVRRLPAIFEESILGVTYGKTRHHPFQLFHEMKIESTTTVHGAAPLAADALAGFKQKGSGPFLKWEVATSSRDTVTFTAVRPRGRFPASEHGAWCESSEAALSALKTPLR